MSDTTTKPIDWDAVVRGEGKRHIACGHCTKGARSGATLSAFCGVNFTWHGRLIVKGPYPDSCDICRLAVIEGGPCSPGCERP